jgi:hypothetical protein
MGGDCFGLLVGLVAGGQEFGGWRGVVTGLSAMAVVVAGFLTQVLGQGYCGLSVAGAVDVGDDLLVLGLIGVAACEDEGEAKEARRWGNFAADRTERVLHKSPK